jgi:hypothetical protein
VIPIGDCRDEKDEKATDAMSQERIELETIGSELKDGEGTEDKRRFDIATEGMDGLQELET